jgi:hypothetical protein
MAGNEVEGHSLYIPVFAPTGTDENHKKKISQEQNVPELTFTPGKL